MNNPALRPDDFLRLLALKFELGPDAVESKAILLEKLETLLHQRRSAGEITALVIDEAQSLSVELLEEIRLLANIETSSTKLLPLVLAGQPELAERLENHNLRQLRQRVTLRCQLEPFDVKETAAFIASRLSAAGGVPSQVFTQDAVMLIHEHARGIPRIISVICDNALVSGMALDRQPVTRTIVAEVCRDFRLSTTTNQNGSAHPYAAAERSAESHHAAADGGVESAAEPRHPLDVFRRNRSRLGALVSPLRGGRVITHEPN
jgi:type II secretory pathway predicted ATPase ExeA